MAKRRVGNPDEKLLKAIIEVFREQEFDYPYTSKYINELLLQRKYWGKNPPPTTLRTVNSYCSQNPHIFRHTDRDEYILERDWYYLNQEISEVPRQEILKNESSLSLNTTLNWRERISIKPDVCHGKACIKGTRVMVSVVLANIAAGEPFDEIVSGYHIAREDIQAALYYAAELAQDRYVNLPQAG